MLRVVPAFVTGLLLLAQQSVAQDASGDPTVSAYASPKGFSQDITSWLAATNTSQAGLSKTKMFANINIPGAAPGTVIAGQSYSEPDYAYNWVRDSSLTMDVVVSLYKAAGSPSARSSYESLLFQYAGSRANEQNDPNLQTGLGEPKFFLNDSVFTGPWGRPQNDGPATAAITLINFATVYLASGGSLDVVKEKLYDSTAHPKAAPVQRDLLFVASNWTSPSFDLWEEEAGDHFYNRLVQRRALIVGAEFAARMGDQKTSNTLKSALDALSKTLESFWDAERNLILYENGPVLYNKTSYKDVAVVLAVLHGYAGDGVFGYTDEKVLASAHQIATSFLPVYELASTTRDSEGGILGIPIGRYPEDIYNGVNTSLANPWYMTTASMAELFYRAVSTYQSGSSGIAVTSTSLPFWKYFAPETSVSAGQTVSKSSTEFSAMLDALRGWGDAFIRRIRYHTPADGRLSEQFHRTSGIPQGAHDLTWSYASILTASFARANASGDATYLSTLAGSGTQATWTSTETGKSTAKSASGPSLVPGLLSAIIPLVALSVL